MTKLRKYLAAATASLVMIAAPAAADVKSEKFVEANANDVLQALNNPSLNSAERTTAFNSYMDKFANMDAVARFTVGKYARRFSESELQSYTEAFREYALAVYEVQLDQYRGEKVQVLGSVDNNAKDSIVKTRVQREDGESLEVHWRVFLRPDGYEVADVALNIEGNVVWLGGQQKNQFLALLDKSGGKSDVLIDRLHQMTAKLRAEQAAGRVVPITYDAGDDVSDG